MKSKNHFKQRLDTCSKAREITSQACFEALKYVYTASEKISELQFKNYWLKEIEVWGEVTKAVGWYDPPPDGIAVLFGSKERPERINYPTLRPRKYWPNPKIYFDSKGLGYVFASLYKFLEGIPIIGDFGFTYYLGRNERIIDHFKKGRELTDRICDLVSIGMTYNKLYTSTIQLLNKYDMENNVYSTTDRNWTNLGHSIPFINRSPTENEHESFLSGNKNLVNKTISLARIFINKSENFTIESNSAFTIEPRLTSNKDKLLPMCSFHTIVQFVQGKKIVLTNFRKIFNLLNMDWLN